MRTNAALAMLIALTATASSAQTIKNEIRALDKADPDTPAFVEVAKRLRSTHTTRQIDLDALRRLMKKGRTERHRAAATRALSFQLTADEPTPGFIDDHWTGLVRMWKPRTKRHRTRGRLLVPACKVVDTGDDIAGNLHVSGKGRRIKLRGFPKFVTASDCSILLPILVSRGDRVTISLEFHNSVYFHNLRLTGGAWTVHTGSPQLLGPKVRVGKWHTIRLELRDVSSGGVASRTVRFFMDGQLMFKGPCELQAIGFDGMTIWSDFGGYGPGEGAPFGPSYHADQKKPPPVTDFTVGPIAVLSSK